MPALELIATLVTAAPGDDGKYRYRQSSDLIDRYLAEARRAKALLILDIQPGRARFMDEVRAYQPYLREPDVGLALDPEWSMRRKPDPGPGDRLHRCLGREPAPGRTCRRWSSATTCPRSC